VAISHALASPSPPYFEAQEDNPMSHPGEIDGVPEFWANLEWITYMAMFALGSYCYEMFVILFLQSVFLSHRNLV
jgi:hypothetical protein